MGGGGGVNISDPLSRLVLERVKCRFHPYIMDGRGWKSYPPHLARILEEFEPLHVVMLTKNGCAIDGVAVADGRGLMEKREAVLGALMGEFGEASRRREFGFNLELIELKDPYSALLFYWNATWFISLCVRKHVCPERFAFIAREDAPCIPAQFTSGKVLCAAITSNGMEVNFSVSEEFFADPKPENARLFGDLLFLAQMRRNWAATGRIEVNLSCHYEYFYIFRDPYKPIVKVLRKAPGLESLKAYAYTQALLDGGDKEYLHGWRHLMKLLDEPNDYF